MEAVVTNWDNLPSEILHLILAKLHDICDFIRSRAVSKTWRLTISTSDLVPQFPWLMVCSDSWESTLKFYSISSNKSYNIPAPESSNTMRFIPVSLSDHRYSYRDRFSLLACMLPHHEFDKRCIRLLNPLNNSETHLQTPVGCLFFPVSSRSRSSSAHFASETHQLALCKPSDGNLDNIGGAPGRSYVYLKGMVFKALKTFGHNFVTIAVIDVGKSVQMAMHLLALPRAEKHEGPFLVESSGEILSVCYTFCILKETFTFYIHQLEFGDGKKDPCWVEVRSIGDRILFFDFNENRGFSQRASDCSGFEGDCIYFIKWMWFWYCVQDGDLIFRYDIKNGKISYVGCPFRNKRITWFIPSLN